VRAMGSVATWDDVAALMARYKVRHCIVDGQPEQHGAKEFAARFKGRVLRAYYPETSALRGQLFRLDETEGKVLINRTMAMDGVYSAVANADERWPESLCRNPDVIRHMMAPNRVTVENADGQPIASWVHTQPDHLFHASVYDRVAAVAAPQSAVPGVLGQAQARGWTPL
jgi:hypothetical protein